MAGSKPRFDTRSAAAERIPSEFSVGDQIFKVKRSGKALKAIIALAPDDETADDPALNVDLLYEGIALVLVDPEGKHPDPEWLSDEVDFQVAQDFMEQILPRAEGNSKET